MRNKISLITILLVLTVISITCKKTGPVDPPEENKPGRRDYTWTVDTLKVSDGNTLYLFSLWGSSPNDVWAVGHGSSYSITIWHYDGVSWKVSDARLSSNFMSVYGFANNDVWATSSPGGICHFNGQQWSMVYENAVSGTLPGFDNIWGDAPNNIYAVGAIDTINGGYKGEILHFDGYKWNIVPITDVRVSFNGIKRGIKESNKYYIAATRFESTGDTNKIFEFDGNNLKEIYSGQLSVNVCEMKGKVYFPMVKKIYKYENNQFTVWKDFTGVADVGRIFGRSEIDFFAEGRNGILHYNGTDLQLLYPTKMLIFDIAVFPKEVFFLCYDGKNSLIIHGKLK